MIHYFMVVGQFKRKSGSNSHSAWLNGSNVWKKQNEICNLIHSGIGIILKDF